MAAAQPTFSERPNVKSCRAIVSIPRAEQPRNLNRRIGGPGVHDDDLVWLARLLTQAGQQPADAASLVKGADDNGNRGRFVRTCPSIPTSSGSGARLHLVEEQFTALS